MNMNYVKCGIMSMLLKEVTFNSQCGDLTVWNVNIGGEHIGYIHADKKQYRAVSVTGYEWETTHFMRALALFIRPAIDALDVQGCRESKYIGSIGAVDDTNFCFEIAYAIYDESDNLYQYKLLTEEVIDTYFGKQIVKSSQYITPFELRYQTLMGFITLA